MAGASLVAQMVKNLPSMQEICVWSLTQKDLLEKGMATHSSILACRIPWTEEPGCKESDRDKWLTLHYNYYVKLLEYLGDWPYPESQRRHFWEKKTEGKVESG